MINGMTNKEWATVKRMKEIANRVQNSDDIRAVRCMVSEWIMRGASEKVRSRRRMASNTIRHAHSQIVG
jgi:hypothetical protein